MSEPEYTVIVQAGAGEKRYPARVLEACFEVPGFPCPCGCGKTDALLLGTGKRIKNIGRNGWSDTYESGARCKVTGLTLAGVMIEAKVVTIFGLEEDERVLNGPWRVY